MLVTIGAFRVKGMHSGFDCTCAKRRQLIVNL